MLKSPMCMLSAPFTVCNTSHHSASCNSMQVLPLNRAQLKFNDANIHLMPCFVVRQQYDWMECFSDFVRAQFVTLWGLDCHQDWPGLSRTVGYQLRTAGYQLAISLMNFDLTWSGSWQH
ncbi:hypothetical protein EV401DRAFT_1889460 [Pisolithus croceorrhizus]|nr:hypothetical protein EV401DRAFT_1889460 [Pisolithus croceorrhizus]